MSVIDELRAQLVACNYTADAVLERITPAGQEGLARNSTIPARDILGGADDAQAILIRLFPLHDKIPLSLARAAIDVEALSQAGLVSVTGQQVQALADIRPYAFPVRAGQWDGWVVCDHIPGLDQQPKIMRNDFVLGLSPASSTLAGLTIPNQVGSALDLGTGCGVQSLHLAQHVQSIVATDVNPRALWMAGLTAELNQISVDIREGSLYQPVGEERFDLIVTNPPYVMSPPGEQRLSYREAAFSGDALVEQVIRHSAGHLTPGGTCQVLANWAITGAQPWQDRLATWAPAGCDLWVIERERLDIYSYIEMWLADAGLEGDAQWPIRYAEWLDYFRALDITSVGMGWITVVNSGRDKPEIRLESWPYEVAQPVGADLADFSRAVSESRLRDAEMCQASWIRRADLVQETLGQPGAGDPEFIVLRQHAGLKRALELTTATGGVLGACDGSLPLGVIIAAVAELLGADHGQILAEVLPTVRRAVAEGYLYRLPS